MLFDRDSGNVTRDARLKRWFMGGGTAGVLLAVLLAFGLRYEAVSSGLVVALWPASMVQLIDPKTLGSKSVVALIAYGSNFLIYGFVGLFIGFSVNCLLEFRKHS